MPNKPTKQPIVTLAEVCEAMVVYVERFEKFPTNKQLQMFLKDEFDITVSVPHLQKFAQRAKNISFPVDATGAQFLTAQVIMNHYKQTFHNIKAVELWYKVFGIIGGETKELESNNENILEVRVIDATKPQ